MAKVMLDDSNWYPCNITGKMPASDYDGDRINVELTENITVKPDGKKPYNLSRGFAFLECHCNCIKE